MYLYDRTLRPTKARQALSTGPQWPDYRWDEQIDISGLREKMDLLKGMIFFFLSIRLQILVQMVFRSSTF